MIDVWLEQDDGIIDSKEFGTFALEVLRLKLSAVDVKELWTFVDINGSGALNILEFTALLFPDVDGKEACAAASDNARAAVKRGVRAQHCDCTAAGSSGAGAFLNSPIKAVDIANVSKTLVKIPALDSDVE